MRTIFLLSGVVALVACGAPFVYAPGGGSGGATASSSASGTGGAAATTTATQSSSSSGSGSGGGSCASGKICNNQCVSKTAPEFGCASGDCTACSFANASATCAQGACSLAACDPGWNDCNGVAADGCETNGPCPVVSAGAAVPVADGAALALDGSSVYYTTGISAILKVAKAGGTPMPFPTPQAGPTAIAVAGGFVFWTTPGTGGVKRCNTDGSGYLDINNGPITVMPVAIAADESAVFWADQGSGDIWQAGYDGMSNLVHLAAGEAAPSTIALDGAHVYWTNATTGDVRRATKGMAMSAENVVTGGPASPAGLAVGSLAVYWTIGSGKVLTSGKGSMSSMGGAPFVGVQQNPGSIAVDDVAVYWADVAPMAGTIMKKPVGGSAVTLVSSQASPRSVAIDGTDVYWVDVPTGTVWKTAK